MRSYEPFGGRLFVQPVRTTLRDKPVIRSHTWEIDGQCRFSPHTYILNFWPFTVGLAFGRWEEGVVEGEEVFQGVRYRNFDPAAYNAEYDAYCVVNGKVDFERWEFERERARSLITIHGLDPDDEMEIMQAAGLFE